VLIVEMIIKGVKEVKGVLRRAKRPEVERKKLKELKEFFAERSDQRSSERS